MKVQAVTDKMAIGLSLLCAIHCLAMPLLVGFLPALSTYWVADESFHVWMLVAVIPTSVVALLLGCKKHKRYQVLTFGILGIAFMVSALALEELIGHEGEKAFTLIGGVLIAIGHILNFRLCNAKEEECADGCETHSHA